MTRRSRVYAVGDPLGDGNFSPIGRRDAYKNGLIRARVTGSFTDLHGAARTLPADWASLAGRYAFDTSGYNPMAWDIHDDDLATEGHTATSMCGGVRRCDRRRGQLPRRRRGRPVLAHSSAARVTSSARPSARSIRHGRTRRFLPDGKLDAGDAPMPAARIDVDLAGTVGALVAADKHVLYSRNRTGAASAAFPNNAHNLYAPFYVSLHPGDISQNGRATRRPGRPDRSRTTSRATSPGS